MKKFFLYTILGGQGIKAIKNSTMPSYVKIIDQGEISKGSKIFFYSIFETDSDENAIQFEKHVISYKSSRASGYLLPGLYSIQKIE